MSAEHAQRDAAHLYDIVRAARLIIRFAADTDAQTFKADDLTRSALLHQFLILGEAPSAFRPASAPLTRRSHGGRSPACGTG